jgi:hypothetical protein
MIDLGALWLCTREIKISGKAILVPFGIELPFRFVSPFRRWITNSGISWAADRVKCLNVWARQLLAGNREYLEVWFKSQRYKGYKIPDLEIFRYLIDHLHNLREVRKVLAVLESHKMVTRGSPSLKGIVDTEKSDPPDHYIKKLSYYCNLPKVPEFALKSTPACNTRKKYCDDDGLVYPGPYGTRDPKLLPLSRRLAKTSLFGGWSPCPPLERMAPVLGRLTAIPDKGKWRTILIGHYELQCKTKPLADWLRQWLWGLPEVASGDQTKFSKFVLEGLGNREFLMSIDLSNATDRLSRELQKQLLIHMGVPKDYLSFLDWPFYYSPKFFGEGEGTLKLAYYSNGQPMGLFVSFPIFELAHYVILKWACAIAKGAKFIICGDDVAIRCAKEDSDEIFHRYRILIERFGGQISFNKTLLSPLCAEGVGAIFLHGIQKEIRIPKGKLSLLEATMEGTWLYKQIKMETPIGRSVAASFLSSKEDKVYSMDNRRALNEMLVTENLWSLSEEAVRSLSAHRTDPTTWKSWEPDPPGVSFNRPTSKVGEEISQVISSEIGKEESEPTMRYNWISKTQYRDRKVSHKIISLYKEERILHENQ